ncbi:SusC/RagA family TonB-linked outer membrane protein [Dinghuibacter silviterrae]|uniref:Iron complex outermembrane receptor protein n=1 Tax=Dinghuibacter silviterrae TaxID=1539049 RepID=A0A4R8DPF3_9BACT|nr:TonB-dependent receptor [Dinghuibacter silviterrae]TDW99961.1 iron complex outermembrane receptor protein [Dinghuibacter silviterrae]
MRLRQLLTTYVLPCLLLLFCSLGAFAQTRTVTGNVTDVNGVPVAGASVTVKGGKRGAVTDSSGNFRLTVPASATSVFITSIGYKAQEVLLTASGALMVHLQTGASELNDVVVIGYGTQQKKDLTGSISSVSSKDFQKGAITSPDQLIAGKVAGVSVTTSGGQPGNSSVIRIRGLASLNGNQDPLIVLDGVILPSIKNPDGTSTISGIADPLSLINPDDIENITVLKDASAAAIYGSRASAGVIIITTKKGRGGKPVFNFNTQNTVGTVAKYVDVLSADQFRAYVNANGTATFKALLGTANTNWQKQIYQTALTTSDNFSVTGRSGFLPYSVSVGYLGQTGILKTDELQRGNVSIHLTPSFFDEHLKVELNVTGAHTRSRFANQGAIGSAVSFDPTQPVYQANSSFGGYFEWLKGGQLNALATRNPVALLKQYNSIGYADNSIGNAKLDYKFHGLPELHAILNLGYDVATGHGTTDIPADAAQDFAQTPGPGLHSRYKQNNTYTMSEFSLNYVKDLRSIKSNINVLGTYGYYNTLTTPYNYASIDAAKDTIASTVPLYPTSPQEHTLISYIGRVIYTYDQKYILTASIRDDGSSRFSPQNRWGTFPAVSAAWRVSQENFMRSVHWLTDLKLRGSYGVTGNQDGIGNYEYIPSYYLSQNGSQYKFGSTYYYMYTPSPYYSGLKWEQTTSANVGLDFGLFNGRLSGSVEYYHKNISNLLNNVFIPVGSNFTNQFTINIGSMIDEGAEFTLNAIPVKTKDLEWSFNFNFAYNKNKITKLTANQNDPTFYGDQVGSIGGGTGNTIQINTVGYSAYSFYVYQQVYGKNGKPLEGVYVDRNRDGVITPFSDQYHYKSPFAPVVLGFSTALDYKRWTLSIVARANIGNYVYDNVDAGLGVTQYIQNPLQFLSNATTDIYNTNFYANQYFSDYYVKNASFLKVDNIGLGYNFGKITKNINLRLNANCQNVFVITKYKGVDPEVYGGIDNNLYPRPRNFTIGAALGF